MRAQNRHDRAKWKAKRKTHLADKCKFAKCPVCHHNKYIGGNNKDAIKPKYRFAKLDEIL